MRLLSITRCEPGMKLAKPIFTDTGAVLLNTEVLLTSTMIRRLQEKGINTLYIYDDATKDIEAGEVISEKVRRTAARTIYHTFNEILGSDQKWRARLSPSAIADFRNIFEDILLDLKQNRQAMNLLTNICAQDHYIYAHSLNVAIYAAALALHLGYPDKDIVELGMGALLHDIGKLRVPGEVLYKPGRLTDDEFIEMKKHAEYGFEFLRNQEGVSLLAAHCAFQHHERLDGTGYPRGLKGDEIHRYARVLAVCDVFDAVTTNRVYRSAMLPHDAMEILYTGSGTHFEPEIVDAFRRTVAIYPIGLTVQLNTGETGVVVDYNRNVPARPVVRVTRLPDGSVPSRYYEIDLAKELTVMIVKCDAIL
ncbi:HD-GYP domain-containing protein [Aneurinibacillus uraniidurans]|uniref:HD-GYP domain-containing protein n=1 Tax=Aneurinibacillus uraniidurans TaxID=2966586 RepID=UPI00234BC305|nr:HD-GYP domain-containing protein [Aneurinibacillus sp. B1]WCN38360.1 HD-GYP domain-containing protein [Aneurinibacillus sp. B1]